MFIEKFANAEKKKNQLKRNKKFMQNYLGTENTSYQNIATGLFRDLETQYTTKLDYIANQEDLLSKQKGLIREKDAEIELHKKNLDSTIQNINTNKRSVVIDQEYQLYIRKFINYAKYILMLLSLTVLFIIMFPNVLA